MMKNTNALVIGLLLCSTLAIGIIPTATAQVNPVASIAVSVAPLGGIVSVIGNEYVDVNVLLPEGVEPHAAQLPQSSLDAASSADLLVLTGHYPWEDTLIGQVDTPYITLEDYEAFGAELLQMPGTHTSASLSQDHAHGNENPHSYWLLPKNAIAIANATTDRLENISPEHSDFWKSSFHRFVSEVQEFQALVSESNDEFDFSALRAVVVFPAEAYIAETFGITVVLVLEEGDNVFISGTELLDVQTGLSNGSIDVILGSDIAKLQQGGEFAYQLAEDTGSSIIWWRAIFFSGLSDYLSIMSYNLGVLVSAMEGGSSDSAQGPINFIAIGLAGFLSVVVLVESVLLWQRIRKEE